MNMIGPVATLLNTVASWVLSPDGLSAWRTKRALQSKKEEALHALKANDFDTLRQRIDELRSLSTRP
jgi:hypothetical protein